MSSMFPVIESDNIHVKAAKMTMQTYEKLIKLVDSDLEALRDNNNSYIEDKDAKIKELTNMKKLYINHIKKRKNYIKEIQNIKERV